MPAQRGRGEEHRDAEEVPDSSMVNTKMSSYPFRASSTTRARLTHYTTMQNFSFHILQISQIRYLCFNRRMLTVIFFSIISEIRSLELRMLPSQETLPKLENALSQKDPEVYSSTTHVALRANESTTTYMNSTKRILSPVNIVELNRPTATDSFDFLSETSSSLDNSNGCVDSNEMFRWDNDVARDCMWVHENKEWGLCNAGIARKYCPFTCEMCNPVVFAVTHSTDINSTSHHILNSLQSKPDDFRTIHKDSLPPFERIPNAHYNALPQDYDKAISEDLQLFSSCFDTIDLFALENGVVKDCSWAREYKVQGSCASKVARNKCPQACDECHHRNTALSMSMYYFRYQPSSTPSRRQPSPTSHILSISLHPSKPVDSPRASVEPSSTRPHSSRPPDLPRASVEPSSTRPQQSRPPDLPSVSFKPSSTSLHPSKSPDSRLVSFTPSSTGFHPDLSRAPVKPSSNSLQPSYLSDFMKASFKPSSISQHPSKHPEPLSTRLHPSLPPDLPRAPIEPSSTRTPHPSRPPDLPRASIKPSLISDVLTVTTKFESNMTIFGFPSPQSADEASDIANILLGPLTSASSNGTQVSITMIDRFSLSSDRRSLQESSIFIKFTSKSMIQCLQIECNAILEAWYDTSKNTLIKSIDSGDFESALVRELETSNISFTKVSVDGNSLKIGGLEAIISPTKTPSVRPHESSTFISFTHPPSVSPSTKRTSHSPISSNTLESAKNSSSSNIQVSWKVTTVSLIVIIVFLSGILVIVLVKRRNLGPHLQMKDSPYPTLSWPSSNHSTVEWPTDQAQHPTIEWPTHQAQHPTIEWPREKPRHSTVDWPSTQPHHPTIEWPGRQSVVLVDWPCALDTPVASCPTIDAREDRRIPTQSTNELSAKGSLSIDDGLDRVEPKTIGWPSMRSP